MTEPECQACGKSGRSAERLRLVASTLVCTSCRPHMLRFVRDQLLNDDLAIRCAVADWIVREDRFHRVAIGTFSQRALRDAQLNRAQGVAAVLRAELEARGAAAAPAEPVHAVDALEPPVHAAALDHGGGDDFDVGGGLGGDGGDAAEPESLARPSPYKAYEDDLSDDDDDDDMSLHSDSQRPLIDDNFEFDDDVAGGRRRVGGQRVPFPKRVCVFAFSRAPDPLPFVGL
jgi:hypothetical protein